MNDERVINRGVDTLVLNGYYTDGRGKVVKRELDELPALQSALSTRLVGLEWSTTGCGKVTCNGDPLTVTGPKTVNATVKSVGCSNCSNNKTA